MSNLTTDFFENNEQSLRQPNIVLRDSLGILAIQLLVEKEDISKLEYDVLLRKLHKIISELHDTYQLLNNNFSE